MADLATRPRSRFVRVRDGRAPRVRARAGARAGVVIGLNVLGWLMLAAVGGRYHISELRRIRRARP